MQNGKNHQIAPGLSDPRRGGLEFGGVGFLLALSLTVSVAAVGCPRKPPEGMVLIPAGPFKMGTDDLALEDLAREVGMGKTWVLDASPSREVDLPAFYIDRTEVTNEAYFQFVRDTGFQSLPHWRSGRPSGDQVDLPVVFVNWFEAQAYCQWAAKRLPTEAEWERAARGPAGDRYPWGNEFKRGVANVGGEFPGLRPVGSLPKGNNPQGVSDLIGNVWEWTDSLYEPYPGSDYQAPEYGRGYRVLRGNSFSEMGHFPPEILEKLVAAQARASYRFFMAPNAAVEDIGFRCAKTAGK